MDTANDSTNKDQFTNVLSIVMGFFFFFSNLNGYGICNPGSGSGQRYNICLGICDLIGGLVAGNCSMAYRSFMPQAIVTFSPGHGDFGGFGFSGIDINSEYLGSFGRTGNGECMYIVRTNR